MSINQSAQIARESRSRTSVSEVDQRPSSRQWAIRSLWLFRIAALFFATLTITVASAQNVYFGNLHSHTSYSDGSGTPDEAYRQARAEHLDFFAVTEHNHAAADGKGPRKDGRTIAAMPYLYRGQANSLVETADRLNDTGHFVTIYGQEFSTISQGNHANVFDVKDVIPVADGDFAGLLPWLDSNRDTSGRLALMQFNHPRDPGRFVKDYGHDDFGTDDQNWVAALDPQVELIEVLNAPALKDGVGFPAKSSEGYYFSYLNLGFHVGPSVGHDNHFKNWGKSTDARVAVLADTLSRPAILDALRARHTYATEDKNLHIVFRSGAALAGDIVAPPPAGSELDLSVWIYDSDEPNASYKVDVFSDLPGGERMRKPVESFTVEGNSSAAIRLDGILATGPGQFVLLRVSQFSNEDGDDDHEEEDRAWTAPIWFENGAMISPATSPSLRIVALLPDPAGDDVQNESVTLRNIGSASIDIGSWQLRDLADNRWAFGAGTTIQPGANLEIRRAGQSLSMNNNGDTIELLDPSGSSVQSVTYGAVAVDQIVTPQ